MPSTYTTRNGIELIATGEQSGTWGDTTNVNLQIIDRALSGVGTITLSGTTHTLDTADGTLSDGMYKVLILAGTPSGTNTITITPNDAQKVYFVYNNSGQSAIFTQGSGGNVTVANGDSKIIYANGGGAGAVVSDFSANLSLSSVAITGGTIDGTVIGGTTAAAITGTTITGTSFVSSGNMTFGDNDKAIFGAGSDLQIYHNGGNSVISDVGTGDLYLAGDNLRLTNAALSEIYARGYANGKFSLYYDNAEKLATTGIGVEVTGTVTADGLNIDTGDIKFINLSTNNVIEGNQGIIIDIDNNNNQTGALFEITHDNQAAKLLTVSENNDISFYEDTGTTPKFFWDASAERLGIGTTTPAAKLQIDNTAASHALLNVHQLNTLYNTDISLYNQNNTTSTTLISKRTDGDLWLYQSGANNIVAHTSGSERFRITSSGNVGIGTSSPSSKLHINTGSYGEALRFQASSETSGYYTVGMAAGAGLAFSRDGTERMRIDSSGRVGIGTSSPGTLLDVQGDITCTGVLQHGTNSIDIYNSDAMLFKAGYAASYMSFGVGSGSPERMRIDSSGNVGIGTTAPAATLDVAGTGAVKVPVGTDAQRPTAATGLLRFNSTSGSFEGYDGSAWGAIGGGGGAAGYFQGENGNTGDTTNGKGDIFRTHESTLNTNVTIASGDNSLAAGPLTVASGVTLTVNGNLSIV